MRGPGGLRDGAASQKSQSGGGECRALANDKCQQVFGQRPFATGQFQVALVENRWQWGRRDPAGVNGYSATVSFRPDRSDAQVEVFFSLDDNGLMFDGATRAPEPPAPDPLDFSPEEY